MKFIPTEEDFYYKIDDILKREHFKICKEEVGDFFKNQTVMITGAGGSIGSELAKEIIKHGPKKIILVDRSESSLFVIEQKLTKLNHNVKLIPSTVNVCDEFLFSNIYIQHKPQFIFHAAAHKHVSLMEMQPVEAIYNNAIGTEIASRLASEHGVKKFILVSTDKAVNPTSIMGASKRLAEMILMEKGREIGNKCSFSIVRFGNIIGSSGSVLSVFYKQLCSGEPLTVTHPEATRYFMSISEAVGLIMQSALQSEGGEIFIFNMGCAVKIIDLAHEAMKLFKLEPCKDIDVIYTGLKEGEKIKEEAMDKMEEIENSKHHKILILRSEKTPINTSSIIKDFFSEFSNLSQSNFRIKLWLASKIPEYVQNHNNALSNTNASAASTPT
jgi:FlaA1/EpsC-like NDP-sugar epimerase